MTYKIYIFIILTLGSFFFVSAQSERKITRKGNTHYETGNFIDAEINYKKALAKNADLLEAQFNLGDALVKQERFDEALEAFEKVSASTENQNLKANALHNKGNVLLSQQDLEGAIESYKDALRINPKDQETRYNYAYVKMLLTINSNKIKTKIRIKIIRKITKKRIRSKMRKGMIKRIRRMKVLKTRIRRILKMRMISKISKMKEVTIMMKQNRISKIKAKLMEKIQMKRIKESNLNHEKIN